MKLSDFKKALSAHPNKQIRFTLPSGEEIPAHAHVTEVARIDKQFVDCGGTFRKELHCRLQTWVADDTAHRLTAGKLLAILNKSASFMQTEDLEVDVEHEAPVISQFPVTAIEAKDEVLVVTLEGKNTDCLAKEKCSPPPPAATVFGFKPIPTLQPSKCCG